MRTRLSFVVVVYLFTLPLFARAEISDDLYFALQEAKQDHSTVKAWVFLADQVDLPALNSRMNREKVTVKERASTVITRLQEAAQRSQGDLLAYLESRLGNGVVEYRNYWISNFVIVEAVPEVLEVVAERPDVSRLDLDYPVELIEPVDRQPAPAMSPGNAEPGLRAINAHLMWQAGYKGQGVVVMNLDTGVDGTHPALSARWRGNHVPADQAWYGPGSFPVDCNDHGTHTMGTITGLDPVTADTIGCAPEAEWIAAGNIDCAGGDIAGSFQWALNPDGDPNTVDDMPAVISNSWRFRNPTNCNSPYEPVITALEVAGVAVVFAAGNEGPGSSTIGSPPILNTTEMLVFSVGAVDGNNPSYPIAGFSSRGPTFCTGAGNQIKPEVSAPGVSVRSSVRNGGYDFISGTSMATPHVAGAIALLKSAFPQFTGNELKQALYSTARDRGIPGEDNDYGNGVIDVWAAFLSLGVPNAPAQFTAYSDYTMPTSMQLFWNDPTHLANGDTLTPGSFKIHIKRDGSVIDSVAAGVGEYLDTGLTDGQEYHYQVFARIDTSQLASQAVSATWIAGGSPVPNPPLNFSVSGDQNQVNISWTNPTENIDGTPMDDFAGVNLYQNDVLVATFNRANSDTGSADVDSYAPAVPGFYEWYLTVIDNENPQNESAPSATVGTPLNVPFLEEFNQAGDPNPGLWINQNTDVNDRADQPPSGPYALNLNGLPNGEDIIETKAIDLSGLQGSGVLFSYFYQPQGTGNRPETEDSLRVYFKNDLGEWLLIRAYPGTDVQPFQQEVIDIESESGGSGTFFHGQFQVRFRSTGGAGNLPNDDWFIDNVSLDLPTAIEDKAGLPRQFAVSANFPNPFNPSTTIRYQLPQQERVSLLIFNTLGQKVRTLLNQPIGAGVHQAVWNGRDDSGRPVASGIYLYRFNAGDYQRTQKMILLK